MVGGCGCQDVYIKTNRVQLRHTPTHPHTRMPPHPPAKIPHRVVAPVDEVAHEDVGGLWHLAATGKELEEVEELCR